MQSLLKYAIIVGNNKKCMGLRLSLPTTNPVAREYDLQNHNPTGGALHIGIIPLFCIFCKGGAV